MPFTRQLVLTQTVIGLVSQASGIDEEAVFTHLSLSEQGVTSIHQHVVIMILIKHLLILMEIHVIQTLIYILIQLSMMN